MAINLDETTSTIAWDGFGAPYIDIDEWRDAPVRHRYVHGGFDASETRFSFYFPLAERYEGRFFQHITPAPESENLAYGPTGPANKIAFAEASGAYFVETNGGGPTWATPENELDPTVAAYRANAAAAAYSRLVAQEMYGPHRVYGYAYGGSGGAYRTIGAAENTTGVWDGFAPHVLGSAYAIPNVFSVRMHAQRVLADKLDRIVDSLEPGGGGDPLAVLNSEERDAYLEVTRMGFPPRSWYAHRTMGTQAFGILCPSVRAADPGYFEDFWTVPGYLGADPSSSIHQARVRFTTTIAGVIRREQPGASDGGHEGPRGGTDESFKGIPGESQAVLALQLAEAAPVPTTGADLWVRSGPAEGTRVSLQSVEGTLATIDFPDIEPRLAATRVGDTVEIDNSNFLAAQTYHRHQVTPDARVWDQFLNPDGTPLYPQRPMLLGPIFGRAAAGTIQSGDFEGKMIAICSLLDREAYPWQGDWYRQKVREHFGDQADDRFRLWFTDNAVHADDEFQEDPTHTVSYLGIVHQALRDLSRWVEDGVEPPASTSYAMVDGQIVVPPTAAERLGVQPVVTLTADGSDRADVAVGEPMVVVACAETPPGDGEIVQVEWDLDADGSYELSDVGAFGRSAKLARTVQFAEPGTYFVTVRVSAERDGYATDIFARLLNLARVRVVVE